MHQQFARAAASFLLASLACFPIQAAGSSSLVISQVYGGGGNSGATYTNDFIEIFNLGSTPVSLDGYSVQYASSSGSTWSVTTLSGTINPGHYFLIQEAAGTGGTTGLPMPDATGTINMSATAGKVALASTASALAGSCPTVNVIDFIGYGNGTGSSLTNCSETSPAPTLTNTTAASRAGDGCLDTDNNSTDFSTGSPHPRNSSLLTLSCDVSQPLTITSRALPDAALNVAYAYQVSASGGNGTRHWSASNLPPGLHIDSDSGVISGIPTSNNASPYTVVVSVADSTAVAAQNFMLNVNLSGSCPGAIPIGQIQGTGDTSPLTGRRVTTTGIVTALRSNAFFLQSAGSGDNNGATSDGIYVFTGSTPVGAAVVGNLLCVSGTVAEYQGQTEIDAPVTTALASNQPLPAPITLTTRDLDPNGPVDQLEKYSGMRVTIPSLTVTGPTGGTVNEANATSTSNGAFYGTITGTPRPFREPGIALTDILPPGTPANVPRWDTNPEVIEIYGSGQLGTTPIDVTDGAVVQNIVGVMSYFPSAYEILPDPSSSPTVSGNLTYSRVPAKQSNELTIASTNLERFYNTYVDPNGAGTNTRLTPVAFANRLKKASLGLRNVMGLPDIVAVEEMQDLNTLQALANQVNSDAVLDGNANPGYQAYLAEGNDISNINVGFLVKSSITVVDVTQYGKSTTFINPTTGSNSLLNDRPPLILRARAARPGSTQTMPFTVIVNHLRSLNGIDDPSTGAFVRAKRQKQAEFLADLIQSRQASDPNEKIIALGDFNAFQFNDGYVDTVGIVKGSPSPADQSVLASNPLVNPQLTALVDLDSPADRYSYTFSGSAQELDQVLLNPAAMSVYSHYAVGRLDADFPEAYRNDATRPERISDHDWPIVYLDLPALASASSTNVTSQVSISSTGLAYSKLSRQYSATLTITNTSALPIAAPVQLVLSNLSAGATLANATGASSAGPYVTALSGGSVAAGGSISVTLRITAPQTLSPTFTPLAYSGSF